MAIEEVGARLVAEGEAQFLGAMSKAQKAVTGVGDAAGKNERPMKGMSTWAMGLSQALGQALYAAAAKATTAIMNFGKETITAASDMAETTSKVGVVFGDWGEDVLHWGKNAAASMGMSSNAALAAAGTYGNLFKSMGLGNEVSVDMSTNLVELAADLASFNNLNPEDVLEKLRAGLTGEAEPLKTLGININEAILKEKALELALWDGEGALSASAKAQAAYALMTEQSFLAAGDFARTSEGLANQQRIAAANVENLKAKLGAALLPIVTEVTKAFNTLMDSEFFKGVLETMTGKLEGLSGGLSELFGQLTSGVGFGDIVGELLGGLITGLATKQAKMAEFAMSLITSIADSVIAAIPGILPMVTQLMTSLVTFIGETLPLLLVAGIDIILALAQSIADNIPTLLQTVVRIIPEMIIKLIEALPKIIQAAVQIILALATGLIEAIPVLLPYIPEIVVAIFNALIEALPIIAEAAVELVMTLITGLIDMLPTLGKEAGKLLTAIGDGIKKLIPTLLTVGKNIVNGIWQGILNQKAKFTENIRSFFKGIVDGIKNLLGIDSPSKVFEGFGVNMMLGMEKGVLEMAIRPARATASAAAMTLAPAMAMAQAPAQMTTYNNYTSNFNLGVTTMQSPSMVQRSFAMMQMMAA